MQELAKELEVVIPVSFFEEANNAHYNSIAIIDADGTDLGLYRKSHIPDGPGIVYMANMLARSPIISYIFHSVFFRLNVSLFFQDMRKSSTSIPVTLASR